MSLNFISTVLFFLLLGFGNELLAIYSNCKMGKQNCFSMIYCCYETEECGKNSQRKWDIVYGLLQFFKVKHANAIKKKYTEN